MTFNQFKDGINWRQILIHFVACCFFIYAFQTFSYLTNTSLVDIGRRSRDGVGLKTAFANGTTVSDLTDFLIWLNMSGLLGLLAGFVIALTISYRRRWFWMNAVFVFIVSFPVYLFDLGWRNVRQLFWSVGRLIHDTTWEFITNGALLLIIGCIFFFHPGINNFIANRKLSME